MKGQPMTKKTDPVIEAIATASERRLAELAAPATARRDNLRDALNAATSNGQQQGRGQGQP